MKILVTGGAGFIGSTVVDAYVQAGHDVTVVDNLSTGRRDYLDPKAAFHEMDIRDPTVHRIVKKFRPDVINHHAAQVSVPASIADPMTDADVNIRGTLNLLEAARNAGVQRFIFASSSAVYGRPDQLPIREDSDLKPIAPYGISKATAEQYLDYSSRTDGLEFVAFRYANVYGPRQYRGGECGVIGLFLHAALADEELTIFGSGEQTRDFVYVGDVARANLLALDRGEGVMNIGTGSRISVNHLVTAIGRAVARELTPDHQPPRTGDIVDSCLRIERAAHQLDWQPITPLDVGLELTTAWLRQAHHRSSQPR